MSTTNPVVYIIYKLKFWQGYSPAHVALGVVREDQEDKGIGRYYQVTGNPVEGMRFFYRPNYNFGKSRVLMDFHYIASNNSPPYDPSAPAPLDPNIPTRECAAWVEEIIERVLAVIETGVPIV
ncbi:hypothetical protein yc1106_03237 [Curvularia clavata]|uniref:Uncharacterized protein n=1 Tax=Curvularia clavata TaxID=95742 RepID=A0A9Q8Z8W6_CURCL|nr:hypothetical protein yc1106_03237 [Curvularia clavata]